MNVEDVPATEIIADTPLIGIVIPCYNAEAFLDQTVGSLVGQTFRQWECVIVDDHSSDSSPQLAKAWATNDSRVRAVCKSRNEGVSRARNAGLAATRAHTPYVMFLDADDVLLPDALAQLLAHLEPFPDASGACGDVRVIDAQGNAMPDEDIEKRKLSAIYFDGQRLAPVPDVSRVGFGSMVLLNMVVTPGAALLRRSHLEAVAADGELFGRNLGCEDWDLWLRMSRRGDFRYVGLPTLLYRHHGGNVSKNLKRMAMSAWRLRWATYRSPENTPEQRTYVRRAYCAWHRRMFGKRLSRAWEMLTHHRFRESFWQSGLAMWSGMQLLLWFEPLTTVFAAT